MSTDLRREDLPSRRHIDCNLGAKGPQDYSDSPQESELPEWLHEVLASPDVVSAREDTCRSCQELLGAHPDMPGFVEAYSRRGMFEATAGGKFDITEDEPVLLSNGSYAKFLREGGKVNLLIVRPDQDTQMFDVADLLPDLNDFVPDPEAGLTGMFRKQAARRRIIGRLRGIQQRNEESKAFWTQWLQAVRRASDTCDERYRNSIAFIMRKTPDGKLIEDAEVTRRVRLATWQESLTAEIVREDRSVWTTGECVDTIEDPSARPMSIVMLGRGRYVVTYDLEPITSIPGDKLETGLNLLYQETPLIRVREFRLGLPAGSMMPVWSEVTDDPEEAYVSDVKAIQRSYALISERFKEIERRAVWLAREEKEEFARDFRCLTRLMESTSFPTESHDVLLRSIRRALSEYGASFAQRFGEVAAHDDNVQDKWSPDKTTYISESQRYLIENFEDNSAKYAKFWEGVGSYLIDIRTLNSAVLNNEISNALDRVRQVWQEYCRQVEEWDRSLAPSAAFQDVSLDEAMADIKRLWTENYQPFMQNPRAVPSTSAQPSLPASVKGTRPRRPLATRTARPPTGYEYDA